MSQLWHPYCVHVYEYTSLALPFATHLSKEGILQLQRVYRVHMYIIIPYRSHTAILNHIHVVLYTAVLYAHAHRSTHHTHIHFLLLQSYHQSHSDVRVYDCSWLWQRSNKQGKRLRVSAYVIITITILACMNCLVYQIHGSLVWVITLGNRKNCFVYCILPNFQRV